MSPRKRVKGERKMVKRKEEREKKSIKKEKEKERRFQYMYT